MNKTFTLLIFLLCAFNFTYAQNEHKTSKVIIPEKDGNIFYERVYNVDSNLTKEVLFIRAKSWLLNLKEKGNDEQIIDLEDKEQGKLMGRGFVYYTQSIGKIPNRTEFKFDITIRDGRYRIQVYDFGHNEIWDTWSKTLYNTKDHWTDDWTMKRLVTTYYAGTGRKKIIASKVVAFNDEMERLFEILNKTMSSNASNDDF